MLDRVVDIFYSVSNILFFIKKLMVFSIDSIVYYSYNVSNLGNGD